MSTDDVNLPLAPLVALVRETLGSMYVLSESSKVLLQECCKELIQLLASEANEYAKRQAKSTITAAHLTSALKELAFDRWIAALESSGQHEEAPSSDATTAAGGNAKQPAAGAPKPSAKRKKASQSGRTPEELLRLQQEKFAESRRKMEAQAALQRQASAGPDPSFGAL